MTLTEGFIKKAEDDYQSRQEKGDSKMNKIKLAREYEGLDPEWYQHFEGQMSPQEVYLSLMPDGVVTVDYSGEVSKSTMPMSVWDVLELRWTLPSDINGDGVTALFEEIKPDLLVIMDGWDTDGLRGELSEAAENASIEIERKIRDIDHDTYCSTVACIEDALEGVELSEGEDLKAVASEVIDDFSHAGVYPTFTEEELVDALSEHQEEQE